MSKLVLKVKYFNLVANTIFGNEEELLLNSFMEKIEKHLVNTKKGNNLIRATTILDITLEDYHKSRLLYGQETQEKAKEASPEKKEKDYNLPRSDKPNIEK
jgi:hypothetical protein